MLSTKHSLKNGADEAVTVFWVKGNYTSERKTNFNWWFLCESARPSFDVADDEAISVEPKKSEEKRPVGKPRKYRKLELDNNELHDFNDILSRSIVQWTIHKVLSGNCFTNKRLEKIQHI